MFTTSGTHTTRRVLTGLAVAAVAAGCMASSGVTTSASGTHQPTVSSATKEWKSSSTHNAANTTNTRSTVSATKEYRSITVSSPSTKEW